MNVKKITLVYILFLVCVVAGFDSNIFPKPYVLAKQYIPAVEWKKYAVYRIPYDDKIAHFFLVGALTFLVNLSLSLTQVSLGKITVLKGSLLLGLFVTLEEFSQMLFPSRSFSWADLMANYAGVLCFGYTAICFMQHRHIIETKLPHFLRMWLQHPEGK